VAVHMCIAEKNSEHAESQHANIVFKTERQTNYDKNRLCLIPHDKLCCGQIIYQDVESIVFFTQKHTNPPEPTKSSNCNQLLQFALGSY